MSPDQKPRDVPFDHHEAVVTMKEMQIKALVAQNESLKADLNVAIEALTAISKLPKGVEISDLDGWYAKRKAEEALSRLTNKELDVK